VSVCRLRYPHEPYCHLWPAGLYNFPHSHKWHDFRGGWEGGWGEGVIENEMRVLIFSKILVWNISHSKKNWARCDQKSILILMTIARYSCQILMKLEFSRQIFKKYSNVKLHENASSGSRVVPCGRTDRQADTHTHTHMTKLKVAFRNYSNAPKN